MGGDPEILELLSKAGADVDKVDFYGKSPLWSAAYHGCASAVTRLLILGADVNKKDDEGVTPLIAAGAGEGRNGKSAVRQVRGFANHHIPPTDFPFKTDTFSFTLRALLICSRTATRASFYLTPRSSSPGVPRCGRRRRAVLLGFCLS